MAKGKIVSVKRIIGTNKVSITIDDDDTIAILTDNTRQKFMLYLRSIISSIAHYAADEYKEEVAYLHPRNLSMYKFMSCKLRINMIGYKNEDYILIKFIFFTSINPTKGITVPIKDVYLSTSEAKDLLKNLDI